MPTISYKNTDIEFQVKGKGKYVVLLHGYIESLNVWDTLADNLEKDYTVVSIDLPGHGNSGIIAPVHTMELMADSVKSVLDYLNIEKATIIGHSMGGYVALQFLEMFPEKVSGLCLFHSTPFADDETRKKLREEIVSKIEAGEKVKLAKEHVEKTFAKQNLDKYTQMVGFFKLIGVNTSNEGTIAALRGMKERKDFSAIFSGTDKKVLWILGKYDNFIPIEVSEKLELPPNGLLEVLKDSGHQGLIEEEQRSVEIIRQFLNDINQQIA